MIARFVVVRDRPGQWVFTRWHETEDEALKEACRLTKKERCKFMVLKMVKSVDVTEMPVEIRSYD